MVKLINPAQISFLAPNFPINAPKNKLAIEVVMKRRLSFMEKELREIPKILVIGEIYKLFGLLQKPSDTHTIKKHSPITM